MEMYGSVSGMFENEITISSWKYLMKKGDKSVNYLLGLYGYSDYYIDINSLSKNSFKIVNGKNRALYRVYGINY